jgi:Zn-dependent peptidase ImmA (M78 family)
MNNYFQVVHDASEFRSQNKLGQREAIKLESLLLKLNVITVFLPFKSDFSGMSMKLEDKRFMLINSENTLGRQNFTICHELYHLYIQKDFTYMICKTGLFNRKDKIEYKADSFAAYFLLPDDGIWSLIPEKERSKNKITLPTIARIEQYFSCSRQALLYRLSNLNLIDFKKYENYLTDIKNSARQLGYPTNIYESGSTSLIIGNYGEIANLLYNKNLISQTNFINMMSEIGINENEIFNSGSN